MARPAARGSTFAVWRSRNCDGTPPRGGILKARSSSEAAFSSSRPVSMRGGEADELRMLEAGVAEPWFVALVLVGFDVDKGQVVESCVPEFTLTDAEREAICFHSMPDSAAGGVGREDAFFSFRVPRAGSQGSQGRLAETEIATAPVVSSVSSMDSDDTSSGASHPSPSSSGTLDRAVSTPSGRPSISSRRLLLAHSLFRQAPDPSSPRGSFQKALVLVTSTPYLTVPHMLLTALADDAFVFGDAALKRAMADAADWPDPRVQCGSRALKLKLLDSELTVSLPEAFLSSFAAPQAAVRTTPDDDDDGFSGAGGVQNRKGFGGFGCAATTTTLVRPSASEILKSRRAATGATVCGPLDSFSPVSSSDTGEGDDEIPAPDLHRHRVQSGFGSSPKGRQQVLASHYGGGRWRRQAERTALFKDHPGASEPALVRCWPACMPSSNPTAPPFHEVDIMRALSGAHDRIWALWELVALGEPLVVLAPTPSQCSAAVMAVMSLIHPLPFVGDWRPYFCIQDVDYPRFAAAESMSQALPRGGVFGVTSPHVLQTLNFPHVLSITGASDRDLNVSYKPGLKTPIRTHLHHSRQLNGLMNAAISARNKRDQNAMAAAAFDVRSCLLERVTRPFLRAFDRYLEPTWGDGRSTSAEPYASDPFGRGLSLLQFSPETFPEQDDLSAPGVVALFKAGTVSRTRARSFYARFVQGPVFASWWRAAREVAQRECGEEHRRHMLEACARGIGVSTQRLNSASDAAKLDETVDLCLRLRSELTMVPAADGLLRARLEGLLREVRAALPDELLGSVGKLPGLSSEKVGSS